MLKEIFSAKSLNNQRGFTIIGPENVNFPARGNLQYIGEKSGIETYIFTPGNNNIWVHAMHDVPILHKGASFITKIQEERNNASIFIMTSKALYEIIELKKGVSHLYKHNMGEITKINSRELEKYGFTRDENGYIISQEF